MSFAEIAHEAATRADASQSDNGNGPTESGGRLRINVIGSSDTFKVEHGYVSVSHSWIGMHFVCRHLFFYIKADV